MQSELFNELRGQVKNWWVSLIIGILFLAVGFLVIFYPMAGYEAIAVLFSVIMLIAGIFEIVFATSNRKVLPGWGWYLALGILDVILGLVLIFIPGLKEAVIPFILAFWLMFRGISSIGYSIDMQRYGSHSWGWYLAFGILAVLCAIGVIFFPMAGAISAVWICGFLFLLLGISRIMLSFDLKKLYDNWKKANERMKSHSKNA